MFKYFICTAMPLVINYKLIPHNNFYNNIISVGLYWLLFNTVESAVKRTTNYTHKEDYNDGYKITGAINYYEPQE